MAEARRTALEMIEPANPLRAKVGPPRPQIPDLLVRAEAALQEMAVDYLCWVAADVDALEANAAVATGIGPAEERSAALQAVYAAAHDIKGQGGTFGFDLVTAVAASLCRYIEKRPPGTEPEAAILAAHVDALKVVVRNRIKGVGGSVGAALVEGLAKAVERGFARGTRSGG